MESVVNYLEDAQKKMTKEMAELFSKMREQGDTMSLDGIKDMYSSKPLEGVLYEPCVSIPGPVGYYCSEYKLPKGEYVIYIRESSHQQQHGQSWGPQGFICMGVTNYGRCFITKANYKANDTYGPVPTNINHIIKVEPLPYKMSSNFSNAFILGLKLGYNSSHGSALFGGIYGTEGVPKNTLKYFTDTTTSLQELNKDFYLFAGKWQPHMTEHATLDIDKMRETIIENTNSIQDLSGKNRELEEQNKRLQAELQELKEQKTSLEKEKARLLPLEKYKEIVIDFMDEHYDGDEPYDHDDTLDTVIIKYFSDWHTNKVFMNKWDYDDVMESKEELNEYRIYKKVKGEMVSSGMDNSGVARNIRSIKNDVIHVKSNVKEIKTRGYSTRHL